MPRASAPSVPGRTRSHRSALPASAVPRGSMTISLAPSAVAWLIRIDMPGQVARGLKPHSRMQRACS